MTNDMNPLFTVIVPIYKVEAYLAECINSIIHQTYTDFELILVDDGSPDNCGKICDEYAAIDSRIRVIHKENGGVTSARLAGAKTAVGTYITCIDGDDWVSSDYLKRFAEYIQQNQPDILCCGFVESYEDKCIEKTCCDFVGDYNKERIRSEIFPVLIEREDGAYFPNNIAGKIIRRELYLSQQEKVDFRIKIGEDCAVAKVCLYHADHVLIISDCLYYYRQNPTSATKNKTVFDMYDPMRIGQHFESQINVMEVDFQLQVYRNVVHFLFNAVTTQFYRKEKISVILKDIKRCLQEPYYQHAIKHCRFRRNRKGTLAKAALKYRLYGLMWLYSQLK